MDISLFVGELLYTNDCVIIPGFGGFVTHYSPSKIHPINHSFYPPSRNILFNSKLDRDDGLLIDYISDQQSLNYAEAKLLVENYAKETLSKLLSGGIARFKNVGNLHRDVEGKLLFSPDESVNYLEESFGLPTFISPPILRKSAHKQLDTKFIDRKPVSSQEKQRRKLYWAYAAVVPVLMFVGWYIFFGNIKPENVQQSSMITLPDTELISFENDIPVENLNTENNPPLESLDFRVADGNDESVTEPEITPSPVLIIHGKSYYIIGGAFGVEVNADKLVAVLRKKGYDANRAGISKSGLHMVSYFSSEDKSEALVNLEIIRKEDNPSAWLLKK